MATSFVNQGYTVAGREPAINPHTGRPVEFRGVASSPGWERDFFARLASLPAETLNSLGVDPALVASLGRNPAAFGGNRGNSPAVTDDPRAQELLQRFGEWGFGDARQDYMVTPQLQSPDGQLFSGTPYESRNSDREAAMGLAAFLAMAGGASLAGLGQTGGAAAGSAGAAGTAGTATLGAGSLATPIATSAALPALGTMAVPTAASLGVAELATIGAGLGGLGSLGTIAPSAATAASSALPSLGTMPAIDPAAIGGTLPSLTQLTGGASLIDRITGGGLGSIAAPVLGAIAGGVDAAQGSGNSQTQQSRLDPNMQRLLYGDNGQGGLLNQANAFFQANRGINPTAQQGLNMSKAFYTDPSYAQGYGQLRNQGLGLLAQPVAGNPFARG